MGAGREVAERQRAEPDPREREHGMADVLAHPLHLALASLVDRELERVGRDATPAIVIGADTTVVAGSHILSKPTSQEDARRMLRLLSGQTHEVLTGLSVIHSTDARSDSEVETTRVSFAHLSESEIEEYLGTGEPFDKAGAYGIQGIGGRYVTRMEGCYFNVMGLPLSRLWFMLRKFGWKD